MIIPEVRRELLEVAKELGQAGQVWAARRIRQLELELYRRRRMPVTPVKSRPSTPEVRAKIRVFKRQHPDASLQEIADRFRVNSARVSEALIGKRR